MMAIISLTIGGLGVVSTMGINMMERRREFGVLRAIGATNRSLYQVVVAESALIGVASWLVAVVVAWPLSNYVAEGFGQTFFEAPLRFTYSPVGAGIWLAISVGFGAAASVLPARQVTRTSVRDALDM